MSSKPADDIDSSSAPLIEHLAELRTRILISLALDPVVKRRDNPEIDVHRLESPHAFVAHIQPQGSDGRLPGEVQGRLPLEPAGHLHPG